MGKIFDPRDHKLPLGCEEFAQSPQTLIFSDRVRVYFSTRVREESGMYLSHVAYVDLSKDLKSVMSVSQGSVIPLGDLGCFDEHGIFPINVIRHHDEIYAYTCGWSRRVAVSVETGVGFAISTDEGRTFKKLGAGPILSSSQNEPYLVGDAFVKVFDGLFHMWYMFGVGWKNFEGQGQPDRIYKIGHATSKNGVDWCKDEGKQIVPDKLGEDESMALPTVIEYDGLYHMFFCYRESSDFRTASGRGYRIGYAYSTDLSNWNRDDGKLRLSESLSDWDGEMQCYPHVFELDGKVFLLYNGNQFGRYGFGAVELVFND
ncbi:MULTISPECIES: hypothetical protein [unclassified Marinobacterium]|uniref:hypothetical protein n=1 Tax=unclassified Marinobacterium TaxID=2644139 RepID=UPI001C2BEC71|nr:MULTISPECIES: hypothetical protein [unclassified Marinobacterium]